MEILIHLDSKTEKGDRIAHACSSSKGHSEIDPLIMNDVLFLFPAGHQRSVGEEVITRFAKATHDHEFPRLNGRDLESCYITLNK
ncbi:hypothetical protein CDAR_622791 [Caerostris darwini]|uniref:Uncharacterized protein n=1 Tax=Caerostris darwini TaxID=1538125 RepID=A0AAV4TBB2_9ARAC|nr:hypothetical protein CDAR_622791 [Caerostris darwini]